MENQKVKLEQLIGLVLQDAQMWNHMNQNCCIPDNRLWILQEIILDFGIIPDAKLYEKVIFYGSLLCENDLIERQIFCWLVSLISKKRYGA